MACMHVILPEWPLASFHGQDVPWLQLQSIAVRLCYNPAISATRLQGGYSVTEDEAVRRASILVVDDDTVMLDFINSALQEEGYQCQTACNAEAGFELIKETPFDLMIADIVLPGTNGLVLTEWSKKIRPDMLVIIMTGFAEDYSFEKAIEAGASDFIKKPFTLQELIIRIRLVELREKLLKMSVTDELTGLYNRRGFFALAEQQLKICKRQRDVLYLLFADLDNLKTINDISGHEAGDRAIRDTAMILKDTFRESDIIARIGGDEFIVVFDSATEGGIKVATSRLYQNIEQYNSTNNRPYTLSISVGTAKYNSGSPCSIDDLIRQADKSMYEQKMLKKEFLADSGSYSLNGPADF